jgi:hypothetical protein
MNEVLTKILRKQKFTSNKFYRNVNIPTKASKYLSRLIHRKIVGIPDAFVIPVMTTIPSISANPR